MAKKRVAPETPALPRVTAKDLARHIESTGTTEASTRTAANLTILPVTDDQPAPSASKKKDRSHLRVVERPQDSE